MEDTPIIRKLERPTPHRVFSALPFVAIGAGLIVLGVGTGYVLNQQRSISSSFPGTVSQDTAGNTGENKIFGSTDEKAFRDTAEGTLEKGGIDNEGSHKLIRQGGESQTAYLTSSTLDLDTFVGKKVRVWGETYQAQKAGWFMDVGRVEILE